MKLCQTHDYIIFSSVFLSLIYFFLEPVQYYTLLDYKFVPVVLFFLFLMMKDFKASLQSSGFTSPTIIIIIPSAHHISIAISKLY